MYIVTVVCFSKFVEGWSSETSRLSPGEFFLCGAKEGKERMPVYVSFSHTFYYSNIPVITQHLWLVYCSRLGREVAISSVICAHQKVCMYIVFICACSITLYICIV